MIFLLYWFVILVVTVFNYWVVLTQFVLSLYTLPLLFTVLIILTFVFFYFRKWKTLIQKYFGLYYINEKVSNFWYIKLERYRSDPVMYDWWQIFQYYRKQKNLSLNQLIRTTEQLNGLSNCFGKLRKCSQVKLAGFSQSTLFLLT